MADALGFASEFKVRQLEKEGRLHPIRGAMGSAWYPRAQVETVRRALPRPAITAGPRARWTDAALIALLRERPRTVVDLVVDAGIPISRAERVYRWWRSHEAPPATTTAPAADASASSAAAATAWNTTPSSASSATPTRRSAPPPSSS